MLSAKRRQKDEKMEGGRSGTFSFLFNGSRDFLLRAAYAFDLKERLGLEMGLGTEEHSPLGICGSVSCPLPLPPLCIK